MTSCTWPGRSTAIIKTTCLEKLKREREITDHVCSLSTFVMAGHGERWSMGHRGTLLQYRNRPLGQTSRNISSPHNTSMSWPGHKYRRQGINCTIAIYTHTLYSCPCNHSYQWWFPHNIIWHFNIYVEFFLWKLTSHLLPLPPLEYSVLLLWVLTQKSHLTTRILTLLYTSSSSHSSINIYSLLFLASTYLPTFLSTHTFTPFTPPHSNCFLPVHIGRLRSAHSQSLPCNS